MTRSASPRPPPKLGNIDGNGCVVDTRRSGREFLGMEVDANDFQAEFLLCLK